MTEAQFLQNQAAEAEWTQKFAAEAARWRHLYESVLANTPDLGYVFDLNHRFTFANEALLKMWGKSWDEAIGKNCLELGYPAWHAAMHDREIEQVIATRKPIRSDVAFSGAHGRRIYDYIFFPVIGANGEVEAVAGTTRDVTERKRAQMLSECQRQTLQSLAEGAPLPDVLSRLVETVERYCGDEMLCSILLLDETGTRFECGIGPSLPADYNQAVAGIEVASLIGTCCHAVADRAPSVASDVFADPKWKRFAELIGPYGLRATWSTPIFGSDGRVLGTFANYYRTPCDPTPQDTGLVEIVTGTAAIAIERRAAEAALRESEQRFRTIVETTPECVKLVAQDGTLLHMNARGLAMICADSAEAVVGQSVYDLIAPEHRDAFRSFNERVCAGEKGPLQFDMIGLDGKRRSMETHAAPFRNPEGEIVQLALTRDVTEQKRADDLLVEQRQLLERVASGRPLDECLTALTASMTRLIPKAQAGVLMADEARTKIARGLSANIPESFGRGIKDTPVSELMIGTCGTAIYEGRPITCPDVSNDENWSKPWRDLCAAHGVLACHSTPVFVNGSAMASVYLAFGEPHEPSEWERSVGQIGAHIAGIAMERDLAMRALNDTQRRLATDLADTLRLHSISSEISNEASTQTLYEKSLEAAIAIMRSEFGSIQILHSERGKADRLRLLAHRGFPPEAAEFWEWIDAESKGTCGPSLLSGRRTVVPDVNECTWMTGTADLAMFRHAGIRACQSTPLISRNGKPVGMISTHWKYIHQPSERDFRMLDIVARQAADLIERRLAEDLQKQTEDALRKTEKFAAAGRMAATIAHEINNPLEAVMNLWFLLNQEDLSPEGRARLETMGEELERVSHITRQTLEFYRQGSTAAVVDLADPIKAAVSLFARRAELNGVVIETKFRTPAIVYGFSGELRQLFANLIGNAIEAGSKTIKIRISPAEDGIGSGRPGVYVLVADNGAGIPDGTTSSLFQPFFTTKAEKGTGLGLWVSKGIVQKHEGWIRVRSSVTPGHRGTTFCMFLPTVAEQQVAAD